MLPQRYFDRFYDWIVRPIVGEADLKAIDQIDLDTFGGHALSFENLSKLHHTYPDGHRLLCVDDTILGYISLWPLTPQQAITLVSGQLPEKERIPMTTAQVAKDGAQFWYIGGMIIVPELRKPIKDNPVGMMMAMALNSWAESGQLKYPTEVLTTAYSPEGAALLKRFGFELVRPGSQMPDGFPLYRRSATSKNALFEIFAQRGIPLLFDDHGAGV